MSERFLKYIPSKEALHLARKHPKAFILLMFIAERARRINGEPDGLSLGQCHIGDHKEFGLTEKEYRTAKKVLAERRLIKIVETCRTRKGKSKIKSEQSQNKKIENREIWTTERATASTTYGTLVELYESVIWDINPEEDNQQKGDRKGDRRATEGRPKGEEQEGRRRKKNEKEGSSPTPSLPLPSKIKFRELVELSQPEYDSLLAKNGQEFLNLMLDALDAYKGSSGKNYDSDFHTMKQGGWVVSRVKKDLQEQKIAHEKTNRSAQGGKPNSIIQPSETQFQPRRVLRGTNDGGSLDQGSGNE